ncbi:MAG: Ig-like domain-containing protein [Candidatus Limnocylindria bacterium]
MHRIRTVRAAVSAPLQSLGSLLSSHRGVTRVSGAALAITLSLTLTQQAAIQAGPQPQPLIPDSLLPQNVGVGVATDAAVSISFDSPMDPAWVEAGLQVLPAQPVSLRWNADATELTIEAERLWRTDESYLIVVGEAVREGGSRTGGARRFSFTTQTAPVVSDFQVRFAGRDLASTTAIPLADGDPRLRIEAAARAVETGLPPTDAADDVSAETEISVAYSAEMDEADVEEHFAITPEVAGELSWNGGEMTFTPSERLAPGTRYTISVVGAHDVTGNVLGGKSNFSFTVRGGAQLTKTSPGLGEREVETSAVEMWFSQPMDDDATNAAFAAIDTTNGAMVRGRLNWNDAGTQLIFTPDGALAAGRTFDIRLGEGATDRDGNEVTMAWSFTTKAAPAPAPQRSTTSTRSAPAVPASAPSSSLTGYALNQINAARAAYGFGPLTLDAGINAVAQAHAQDQASNGYFSHTSRDGRGRDARLVAGGVSFSASGENQCYLVGRSLQATLDWCHAQFMAEPYPGHWNHIANILNPKFHRLGVGIGQVGGRVVVTWNFTD